MAILYDKRIAIDHFMRIYMNQFKQALVAGHLQRARA
jgi:hypothetical protein